MSGPVQVPFRYETEQLLWVVDDVYSPAECDAFVALIERSSPTLATNNALYRDQDRVVRDEAASSVRLPGAVPWGTTGRRCGNTALYFEAVSDHAV